MTAQSDAIIAIHMSKSKRQMSELSAPNNLYFVRIVFLSCFTCGTILTVSNIII